MNSHIELVKKWLAEPTSVSQAELDANSKSADADAGAEVVKADAYSAEAYAAAYYASAAHAAAHWEFARAERGVRAYEKMTSAS